MRQVIQLTGFVLAVMGVSGTIDRLFYQPIMGPFLNAFNRYVIEHVDALNSYEVFANLTLAVVGFVVAVAGEKVRAA